MEYRPDLDPEEPLFFRDVGRVDGRAVARQRDLLDARSSTRNGRAGARPVRSAARRRARARHGQPGRRAARRAGRQRSRAPTEDLSLGGRRDRGPDAAEPEPRRGPHPPGAPALLTTGPGTGSAGVPRPPGRRAASALVALRVRDRGGHRGAAQPPLHAPRQAGDEHRRHRARPQRERGHVDLGAIVLDRAQHAVHHLLRPCSSRRTAAATRPCRRTCPRRARSRGRRTTRRRRRAPGPPAGRGRSRAGRTSSPSRPTCRRSPPCRRATT